MDKALLVHVGEARAHLPPQSEPRGDAAALPRPWQDVTTVMSPQRHQAYALQWLGLAVAALIMYLIARLRGRRRHQPDA